MKISNQTLVISYLAILSRSYLEDWLFISDAVKKADLLEDS